MLVKEKKIFNCNRVCVKRTTMVSEVGGVKATHIYEVLLVREEVSK